MTAIERPAPAGTVPPRDAVSWIEIDLSALRHNYHLLRAATAPEVRFIAVVKADAYGHGAVPAAKALETEGADLLAVARVEEARELRGAGLAAPLLILAPPFAGQADAAVALDAAEVVCNLDHARAMSRAAQERATTARVHLKVDVGMGRLGCRPESAVELAQAVAALPGLRIEGVMTHFPCADGATDPPCDQMTRSQIAAFRQVRTALIEAGAAPGAIYHAANSATTLDYPEAHFDAVRCGISLYGQQPSFETRNRPPLRPVMAVKTRIAFLKDVPAGTGLSYGHTCTTERLTRVATVPMGYADGYPRHASSKTYMLVHGKKAPVLGRVCMDHTLIDVTDAGAVRESDEVLVFGQSGEDLLRAEDVAAAIGTIGYELTTRIGKRLPRVYLD